MKVAAEKIRKDVPWSDIHELTCDLSSMESVRKCAEDFKNLELPINVLINNAGVMIPPFSKTKEGYELQFGTNHLGHFLLTNLLIQRLKDGAPSRIVNVASLAHNFAPKEGILFDHLKDDEYYQKVLYYGQSKLCNMLHAMKLNKLLQDKGITCVSLHPGTIYTNLARHSIFAKAYYTLLYPFHKSEPQGASTTIFCSFAGEGGNGIEPGGYHSDCNVCKVKCPAFNGELADKLWDYSVSATDSNN
mmetsp:Transcript_18829/g.27773  ORF Transcript_18829/g.27773 Transcript_18829/m.27773 type:complete len:246 (+) Transcript_18829:1-738(+)